MIEVVSSKTKGQCPPGKYQLADGPRRRHYHISVKAQTQTERHASGNDHHGQGGD